MGFDGVSRRMVEVTQEIEEQFSQASKGDFQYKLETLSPTKRYPKLHEAPEVLEISKGLADGFKVRKKAEIMAANRKPKSRRAKRMARKKLKLEGKL